MKLDSGNGAFRVVNMDSGNGTFRVVKLDSSNGTFHVVKLDSGNGLCYELLATVLYRYAVGKYVKFQSEWIFVVGVSMYILEWQCILAERPIIFRSDKQFISDWQLIF